MQRSIRRSVMGLALGTAGAIVTACGSRGPELRHPVGQTWVTSAPSRARVEPAPGYVPPSLELYVAEQSPGPCGMDRLPPFEFDFGSSTLAPTADLELSQVARCLIEPPFDTAEILLVGHADPIGSARFNLDLAYARAATIRSRLVELGVPAERVVATAAGESRLPQDRWTDARRVDVVIARPGAATVPPASAPR